MVGLLFLHRSFIFCTGGLKIGIMETETWKDIVGFTNYQVSDLGRVRNKTTGRILRTYSGDRYLSVMLGNKNRSKRRSVHRLVAEAFMGEHDDNAQVNHINGNRHDNRLVNLEWSDASKNQIHAVQNGLTRRHPPSTNRYTRPVKVLETGNCYPSLLLCAEDMGFHKSTLWHYLNDDVPHNRNALGGLQVEYITDDEYYEWAGSKKHPAQMLYNYQMAAVKRMFDGCILNGGVGSGKSRTGLYYYFKEYGGSAETDEYIPMKDPIDLYIISTAKKRDDLEWESELGWFLLTINKDVSYYKNTVTVDSWQNIQKYIAVKNAFFIFDEDHVTGYGAWSKAFLKIAKNNRWIILSASPGDKWEDFIPVFIANGFYKNKTEFVREHIVYSQYSKYPRVERYLDTAKLLRLRDKILIDMDFRRHTIPHHEDVYVDYDTVMYKDAMRKRWDPYKDEPLQQASALCYLLRRIVNSDEKRQMKLLELLEDHPRAIIFYNYDYERDILLHLGYGDDVVIAEWTGHKHESVPSSEKWVYLVNYNAGCEGFNCTKTDTMIFYSQSYSYKTMMQAAGRIDRLNSPYVHLYYYHLKSRSGIDLAISRALKEKKKFNEQRWIDSWK